MRRRRRGAVNTALTFGFRGTFHAGDSAGASAFAATAGAGAAEPRPAIARVASFSPVRASSIIPSKSPESRLPAVLPRPRPRRGGRGRVGSQQRWTWSLPWPVNSNPGCLQRWAQNGGSPVVVARTLFRMESTRSTRERPASGESPLVRRDARSGPRSKRRPCGPSAAGPAPEARSCSATACLRAAQKTGTSFREHRRRAFASATFVAARQTSVRTR